jgi:hypothetical protein
MKMEEFITAMIREGEGDYFTGSDEGYYSSLTGIFLIDIEMKLMEFSSFERHFPVY